MIKTSVYTQKNQSQRVTAPRQKMMLQGWLGEGCGWIQRGSLSARGVLFGPLDVREGKDFPLSCPSPGLGSNENVVQKPKCIPMLMLCCDLFSIQK